MCIVSTLLTASFQLQTSVHMLQFIQTKGYENKKQWSRNGGTQQRLLPYSDTAVTVFCGDMWNGQFLATFAGAFCMSTITFSTFLFSHTICAWKNEVRSDKNGRNIKAIKEYEVPTLSMPFNLLTTEITNSNLHINRS